MGHYFTGALVGDFISQASFDRSETGLDRLELPSDALGHTRFANLLLDRARELPPGSVIAVQGSWGRGKTDVLARLARQTWDDPAPRGVSGRALWINPWQYGYPDLLTPLVIELLGRAESKGKLDMVKVRAAAKSVIKAGVSFGAKAATVSMPAMGSLAAFADAATGPTLDILEAFLARGPERVDLDPVAAMARRFRELVEFVIPEDERKLGGRLIVCVDDLDRCLPDRQVALLQALRFLCAAGAPVTILVALDPTLARQAIVAHYRTDAFDPERYLDKMFHLRLHLPAVGPQDLGGLVEAHLNREVLDPERLYRVRDLLRPVLGEDGLAALPQLAGEALSVPDLRNPRVIERIFRKLEILGHAAAEVKLTRKQPRDVALWLMWLAIAERWPDVRAAMQDADSFFAERFGMFRERLLSGKPSGVAVVDRLAEGPGVPELTQVLRSVREDVRYTGALLQSFDEALVGLGL